MRENNTLLEYYDIFSYNFRRLRYHHKQTQQLISIQTNLTEPTINAFELGRNVTLTTVATIADHFKVNLAEFLKEKEYNEDIIPLLKLKFVDIDLIPDDLKNSFNNFFLEQRVVIREDFLRWVNYLEYKRIIYLANRNEIVGKFNKLVKGGVFHYNGRHHAFLFDFISNQKEGVYILSNKSGTHNCRKIC